MLSKAKDLNIFSLIALLKYVFNLRKVEMDLSHVQVVTGMVPKIFRATKILGKANGSICERIGSRDVETVSLEFAQ